MMFLGIEDGGIVIRVDLGTLKTATEYHPDFWDGERGVSEPNVLVDDIVAFAREVVFEMGREEEDGTTLLISMLDKAILRALENGAEGARPKR